MAEPTQGGWARRGKLQGGQIMDSLVTLDNEFRLDLETPGEPGRVLNKEVT